MRNPVLRSTKASALAAALLALACSPRASSRPTAPEAAPTVVAPSGKVYTVEVAQTDEERAQGLMFRASLGKDAGMVFLFAEEAVHPFWMKNCHFPIDIVFTRKDGTVVDVLAGVPPCPGDPCPSYPPKGSADTAFEINAGEAKANGIEPGARLRYQGVPGR